MATRPRGFALVLVPVYFKTLNLHSQKSTGRVRPVTCPLQDVYHILVRDRWVDSTKQAVQIQPVNGLEIHAAYIQPVSLFSHV